SSHLPYLSIRVTEDAFTFYSVFSLTRRSASPSSHGRDNRAGCHHILRLSNNARAKLGAYERLRLLGDLPPCATQRPYKKAQEFRAWAYSEPHPVHPEYPLCYVCFDLRSSYLLHTGHCDRWSWNRSPFILCRSQVLFGIHRLFPGNHLTCVCRHTAHDREEGALRHVLTVIDGLAVANACEKLVMLGLVNVVLRP